jgi:hypothetical protein
VPDIPFETVVQQQRTEFINEKIIEHVEEDGSEYDEKIQLFEERQRRRREDKDDVPPEKDFEITDEDGENIAEKANDDMEAADKALDDSAKTFSLSSLSLRLWSSKKKAQVYASS